jgi:parallel beta-helix repeat protein
VSDSAIIRGNVISKNSHYKDYNPSAGIKCSGSSAIIEDNIIEHNHDTGICVSGGSHVIKGNTLTGNTAGSRGGGAIRCSSSSAIIIDNVILRNTSPSYAAALYVYSCSTTIMDNTINENTSYWYGGGIVFRDSDAALFLPFQSGMMFVSCGAHPVSIRGIRTRWTPMKPEVI